MAPPATFLSGAISTIFESLVSSRILYFLLKALANHYEVRYHRSADDLEELVAAHQLAQHDFDHRPPRHRPNRVYLGPLAVADSRLFCLLLFHCWSWNCMFINLHFDFHAGVCILICDNVDRRIPSPLGSYLVQGDSSPQDLTRRGWCRCC